MTTIIKKTVDDLNIVHTVDLGGRAFLTVHTGTLSKYIAEIHPFNVSWPLESQTESKALLEARDHANHWLRELTYNLNKDNLKPTQF